MSSPRESLAAFCELLPERYRLARWQLDALALDRPVSVIVAGRGMGKSLSLAVVAVWWAFRRPGQRVLIVSASEFASRRLLSEVRAVCSAEPLRGSVTDEQASVVELTNGSEVRSLPASERAIRGNVAHLLLADEAALIPDELLLGACFPTTATTGGPVVLASSASVAAGAFYDHAARGEAGDPGVAGFRWVARAAGGDLDAPWITPTAVARDRASLGDLRFRAEYLGEFATGADSLFSLDVLERATADYSPYELAELRGPARVAAGVDWGQTTDRSALVAIGRVPGPEAAFAVVCANRWPAGHPLHEVVEEIAGAPAHFDTVAAETNGLGGPLAGVDKRTGAHHGSLWRRMAERPVDAGGGRPPRRVVMIEERPWRRDFMAARVRRERFAGFATRKLGVHTSAEQKAATYGALRLLLERGHLVLSAAAEELRRELLMTSVDLTATGGERIGARSGHDDLADALSLALAPYRRNSGDWRTLIADLAEARHPEAPTPAALGTTTTPGGVAVPLGAGRLPIFASVAGAELTVPPGTERRVRDDFGARVRAVREHRQKETTDAQT